MFTDAGYVLRSAPKIGDFKLDIWALGANEVLFAGLIYDLQGETEINADNSKWRDKGGEFESPVLKSVSYTHLDVYKRQSPRLSINSRRISLYFENQSAEIE